MTLLRNIFVRASDSPSIDAFSRWRTSNPYSLFDAQLTYGLQPTVLEQVTAESGATIAHDSTNRCALLTFSSTPTGGKSYMQSYEFFRYQPLKSQLIAVTFNFIESVPNVIKFAGYSDVDNNGMEFQNNGSVNQFVIKSGTSSGNQTVTQANWNLDKLDGTGNSKITLDITKTQILILAFQALYVGRVRVGFDIGGSIIYCHEFKHANLIIYPYIQTANLPIVCGMTCTGTVSTTMNYICSGVVSEGGQENLTGLPFYAENSITAGNNTRTHCLSIRPRLTFNSITNRIFVGNFTIDVLVTGNTSCKWELVAGQAITGGSFADVDTTYSSVEFSTAGTISGSPFITLASGYSPATNNSKSSEQHRLKTKIPFTLDAAGAVRLNGTYSVVLTGLGATSAARAILAWEEIR